jgi:hypothetical protein
MDLRLLDEIVTFMDGDGLANRYDHVIMAGAALGALGVPDVKREVEGEGEPDNYDHWRRTFEDHLTTAQSLHHIKDVYIIEHRDCGAYREFLKAAGTFDDYHAEEEAACHQMYADRLIAKIKDWAKDVDPTIQVKSFLMDLRGKVTLLSPLAPPPLPAVAAAAPKKGKKSKKSNKLKTSKASRRKAKS